MTVLVAYDGSDPAQKALHHAATHYPDDEIVLLRVIEAADGSLEAGIGLVQEKLKQRRQETEREISAEVGALIQRDDLELRTEIKVGKPARVIVDFAETHDVECIVIGNHGREGVSRVLLGSVAERVVRRAPTTVTVVR